MHLFDTHCHLDQEEFDVDREAVIRRAQQQGVSGVVTIGVNAASSQSAVRLAEQYAGVYAAVGIHPNYCAQVAPDEWDTIAQLARHPRVVALGETGLDYFRDYAPAATQEDYFDRHLRLSQLTGLPFIVHTRTSEQRVMEMLQAAAARGPLHGIMHSFTGDAVMAERCLGLGLFISFAGMVTFKKSEDLRAVARSIPDERLLIETDAPYLAPQPVRGKRNEPANLAYTAECLAQVRGCSPDELAAQTTANARRVFRLDPAQ
ncbi:MAG: TatD family hydrolase [Pirellulales bacterium]|nr:TatD family hydrolase [Pirellulales bacterium]